MLERNSVGSLERRPLLMPPALSFKLRVRPLTSRTLESHPLTRSHAQLAARVARQDLLLKVSPTQPDACMRLTHALAQFPAEILSLLFGLLERKDVLAVSSTCRSLREVLRLVPISPASNHADEEALQIASPVLFKRIKLVLEFGHAGRVQELRDSMTISTVLTSVPPSLRDVGRTFLTRPTSEVI